MLYYKGNWVDFVLSGSKVSYKSGFICRRAEKDGVRSCRIYEEKLVLFISERYGKIVGDDILRICHKYLSESGLESEYDDLTEMFLPSEC